MNKTKEEKYYTPSIEEFHVGFECEFINNSDFKKNLDTWKPLTFVNGQHITNHALENLYRVKYLDKEDIESLGFDQLPLPYQFKKDWYRLIKRHEEDKYIVTDDRHQDQIFVGVIKNKSELKTLLKQLEIN